MGWISDCPVLHDIVYGIKPWKILAFAAFPVLVDHIFIAFLQRLDLVPTLFRGSFVIEPPPPLGLRKPGSTQFKINIPHLEGVKRGSTRFDSGHVKGVLQAHI